MECFYAHTKEGMTDKTQWQTCKDHLEAVSQQTGQFASTFNHQDFGQMIILAGADIYYGQSRPSCRGVD